MSSAVSATPPTPPPLPPRADRRRRHTKPPSPSSSSPPNLTSPIVQAAQDVEHARRLLDAPTINDALDDADKEIHRIIREKEVTQLLMRITDWVEELSSLLQQSYKKESELESKLALAQPNPQTVHVNNDLEEPLKRPSMLNGSTIREFGWRAWSKRDNRRISDDDPLASSSVVEDTLTPLPKPQSPRNSGASFSLAAANTSQLTSGSPTPSRFFNFSSLTRASPSSILSTPPLTDGVLPPKPTQREKELEQQLEKERQSLQKVMAEKTALEGELETLSQALFEQANKMVSNSNKKLAEIEEELRIAMEEREALKSTLRVIASHSRHNEGIRDRVSVDISPNHLNQNFLTTDPSTPRAHSRSSSNTSSLIFELSPTTPHQNQGAHDTDEDGEEVGYDDEEPHSQPPTPSSTHNVGEEQEASSERDTEIKKEPDGSIYSQSESSHVQDNEEVKEESVAVNSDSSNADIIDGDTQNLEASLHEIPASSSLAQTPSKESGEEQVLVPSSSAVPDMASMSPVSQYTLESVHQSM